jgi:bis(5'-nucleosidyl)-tetraphosphatase
MLSSAAVRYTRSGFRPLTPTHERLVEAAEALRAEALRGRGGLVAPAELPLEQHPDLSCGCALTHAGAVLLIHQRTATGAHWALPKGHLEAGETDLAAALREVREETGVALDAAHVLPGAWAESRYTIAGKLWGAAWSAHAGYPNEALRACVYHKTVRFCLAALPAGAPRPQLTLQEEEVQDAAWLPFAEGLERLTFAEERAALSALLQRLQ